jgi:hypothetical protein
MNIEHSGQVLGSELTTDGAKALKTSARGGSNSSGQPTRTMRGFAVLQLYKHTVRATAVAAIAGTVALAADSGAATRIICPAPGGGPQEVIASLNGGSKECWTGPTWENGLTWASGKVTRTSGAGRSVGAYAYSNLRQYPTGYARVSGYSSNNVPTCFQHDFTPNGAWEYNTSSLCNNTSYVVVTALESIIA